MIPQPLSRRTHTSSATETASLVLYLKDNPLDDTIRVAICYGMCDQMTSP